MATFIINKIPRKILSWKTLYELLHKVKPDYCRLRVFGFLVCSTVTKPHKLKFEPRANKFVFLGYIIGEKSYKWYDLESHAIFSS